MKSPSCDPKPCGPPVGNFWGALIKRLREEQGIPQRRIAAETGVHRSSLRYIESGQQPGNVYVIETLLAYLGYELDAIKVGGAPSPSISSCHDRS